MNVSRYCIAVTLIIVFLLVVGGYQHTAYSTPEDAERKIDQTREEIAELQRVLKALDGSIQERMNRVEELSAELDKKEAHLKLAQEELSESELRLEEKTQTFGGRVRSIYMNGGLSYLDMLLEAESFGDLVIRMAYLTRILNHDAVIVGAFRDEYNIYKDQKNAIDQEFKKLKELRHQKESEYRNLVDQRRQKDALLSAAESKLAGELAKVTPQAERKPVYGIVFDNAPQARPQHGLARASVVYEYEVEGRITRYLGLFSSFPTKVGPIRSARFQSAMLALENRVHFIYSSAGVDVLAKIKEWEIDGTNALYAKGFYRDSSRRAPHNLYVNLSTLGTKKPSQEVIIRPAYLTRKGQAAKEVSLRYSPSYVVKYEYVPAKGAYNRYINGRIHKDATGQEILARNIIIQYTPHGFDGAGRPVPEIIGRGTIGYYSLGEYFSGTWVKDSISARTRYYYKDGTEIERVYGQTWIQIARPR